MELQPNIAEPLVMHVDLNSCFATVEQQANPLLRGKPIVVAAYATNAGCVLAPSIEAKRFGIKTGMRVKEAKALCPYIKVLKPDPPKYRYIYSRFCKLFSEYTPNMHPKSIDEAVLYFAGTPVTKLKSIEQIGREIKYRMRQEIGDWLSCNVGIGTNGFLAKTAAGLHKPDGLDVITYKNLQNVFSQITLLDLCGINVRNQLRLNLVGIATPLQFLQASEQTLRVAFQSINGYYWYMRLRGYEIDNVAFQRRTIGHSYALPKGTANLHELSKLLYKLCEKVGRRLRRNNYTAYGIHVSLSYRDGSYWHHGHKSPHQMYSGKDLFLAARAILAMQPEPKLVRILAVNCFALVATEPEQLTLFQDRLREQHITQALDTINNMFGEFTITPATLMGMQDTIIDRIAFGGSRDDIKEAL